MKFRTIKCKIDKGSNNLWLVYVIKDGKTAYYHATEPKDLEKYVDYYNYEKIYPNTEIHRELYPHGKEDGDVIIVRELRI